MGLCFILHAFIRSVSLACVYLFFSGTRGQGCMEYSLGLGNASGGGGGGHGSESGE